MHPGFTVSQKASTGISIAFPDVCKTPAPPIGVPIPYPATATTALKSQQNKAGAVAQKAPRPIFASSISTKEAMQLHNSLNQVNAKLRALQTPDPNEWQKVLAEYAVLASALYKTLFPGN